MGNEDGRFCGPMYRRGAVGRVTFGPDRGKIIPVPPTMMASAAKDLALDDLIRNIETGMILKRSMLLSELKMIRQMKA